MKSIRQEEELVALIIWEWRIDFEFFVKSARAITQGAKTIVPIAMACAAAGIIAGTLGIYVVAGIAKAWVNCLRQTK